MKLHRVHTVLAVLALVAIVSAACAPAAAPTATPRPQPTAAPPSTAVPPTSVPPTAVPEPTEAEPAESYYVVYVPKLVHPFYEDVKAGIEKAISEYAKRGVEVKFDWDAPPQADVLIHTQRLEAAISKQPDAICVSCLDPDADRPLIEQAAAAGIPMFGFDTECPGSPILSFVGHADLLPDGASMADALAEAIGEDGPIAILMGSPGSVNHRKRVDGFKAQLENYPNIEIVAEEYDNDDLERAINLTASILQAHPDLEGIFGCNSTAPVGAGRAIVEAGKKGEIALVGIGDLPEMIDFIKDGTALATSVQPVPQIGYWSIRYMYEYLNGNVLPPLFDTGSVVVDASNADTYK